MNGTLPGGKRAPAEGSVARSANLNRLQTGDARISDIGKTLGAFAAAIILVCGVLYVPRHHFYFHGSSYAEFFERLPVTLELIIASTIVAFAVALFCTLLYRPMAWLGAIVAAVLFGLMCVPVFWLALMAQLLFAVQGVSIFGHLVQLPSAGSSQYDTFNIPDRLTHLVLPATLLAVVQAGAYVDSMRGGISARKLFSTFAALLPTILSADLLVEILFAWPGVGRAFYQEFAPYHTSYMVAFFVFSAFAVVVTRTIARSLNRFEKIESVEVFQPL